ncbi:hypothetical protein NUACC21_02130 [Scytonema sp. NUACC21]
MSKNAFASPTSERLLANRYQLKQFIGRGGMGEVFLADDILLGGIPVAIKFLSQTVEDPKMEQDFAREARICAALSQKSIHIVRVTDYGVSRNGKPFYVMEYLSGKTLKDLIPMSLPIFLSLCRQICLGLQCAHNGMEIDGKIYPLVHRDIKPANVLVLPDTILGQLVKILDFGIAKFVNYSSSVLTTSKEFHGTLPYCSPEQLDVDELDNRSDIYSLGVLAKVAQFHPFLVNKQTTVILAVTVWESENMALVVLLWQSLVKSQWSMVNGHLSFKRRRTLVQRILIRTFTQ